MENIERIYKEKFNVTNKANARIVIDSFSIAHEDSATIDPICTNKEILDGIVIFYSRDKVKIDFDVVEQSKASASSEFSVKQVDSENGEHTIFSGLIEVNETKTGKAVEVDKSFTEASIKQEFLEQHWKKIEVQLQEIDNVDVVEGYLEIATELGIAGKKLDLIKQRIKQLS